REDFARVEPDRVGRITYFPRAVERYLSGLLALLDREAIRRAAPRVAVGVGGGPLGLLLPALLRHLGCRVHQVETAPGGAVTVGGDFPAILEELGAETVRSGAQLGVAMEPAGENLRLVDETGRPVPPEAVELLLAWRTMRQGLPVVVPVSAPGAVEKLAARLDARVVRTKSTVRARMEAERQLMPGTAPYFHAVSDALLTLARVLEGLAKEGATLSRLLAELPPCHTARAEVPCDWTHKGRVMRSLLEEFAAEEGVDFTDGVKVHPDRDPDAWVLVQPDADAPYFRVITEGRTANQAQAFLAAFRERILALEGNSTPT
ncbi:MAG TPA: hypothetical protein GXX28_03265, partial [Firmicutes bacterium]|nr:hypothetical protein [Bacillota bacterium]